jgi:hypothetical protein
MNDEPKNSDIDQEEENFDRPSRERLSEVWLEIRKGFRLWIDPILSNKTSLITLLAGLIIGIFALIRGIMKAWF